MIDKRQHSYPRHFSSALLVVCLSIYLNASFAQARPGKAESRKIFTKALNKFLATPKPYTVCLPPMLWKNDGSDAIDVNETQMAQAANAPTGLASQLKALEEVGLVAGTTVDRTVVGNRVDIFSRFKRTDKGNSFFARTGAGNEFLPNGQFCYARAALEKIVKWRGPATFGEYSIAWVSYTTKLTEVADWVKTPAVLAAFPAARANLIAANSAAIDDQDRKPRQVLIDLTSDGWEVNEWSKVLQ